jgi:hypothetical protein
MAVRLSALRAGRSLLPGRFLVLISVRGWVDPTAIVRLEWLGPLIKIHLIGTRTPDLPVCSIVPQPTTLPHAPSYASFCVFCQNKESRLKIISINLTTETVSNCHLLECVDWYIDSNVSQEPSPPHLSTLKMKETGSTEMLVLTYQTTRRHNPDDLRP